VKKLVLGIIDFHNKLQPGYRETFARLALGQKPDALFIACSDSRVAVNVFASTDPGDLFVIRNVGNIIPPCGENGKSMSDESEAAAIEFALNHLNVSHIVICGHAECGAMKAIAGGRRKVTTPHLRDWLRHGERALQGASTPIAAEGVNDLSKQNVLLQIEHLKSYPDVRRRLAEGNLQIHGLWFDLPNANVYYYDRELNEFVILDQATGDRILPGMEKTK
jgi:carbonic anhydrase